MAGFVAENILEKRLHVVPWYKANELTENDLLIDVRDPYEFAAGQIPGAINIPIDDLRRRLGEIPRDKCIYIYCQIGLRGYLGQRILLQKGFKNVKNISGGYKLWSVCNAERKITQADE